MTQQATERFQYLIQQLELTDDVYMSFFERGELSRMTVHKKKRVWQFGITLEHILPYQMYQLMRLRMVEKFAHIAQVSLSIEARVPQVTEQLIHDYWLAVIEAIDDLSPP